MTDLYWICQKVDAYGPALILLSALFIDKGKGFLQMIFKLFKTKTI